MARTKAEVRAFLDAQIGKRVVDKSNANLNGQCVALIKALMEFLGVADPYAARGNAKDAGDRYIAQDIGEAGRGWLTICVNRNMGGGYGHIWVDLLDEANYESNGALPITATKNTRPINQAQQFVNFNKWIKADVATTISNTDADYQLYLKAMRSIRGPKRPFSKEEFVKNFVGNTDRIMIDRMVNHPEADQNIAMAEYGIKMTAEKVEAKLADANKKVTELTKQLEEAKKQSAGEYIKVTDLYVRKG